MRRFKFLIFFNPIFLLLFFSAIRIFSIYANSFQHYLAARSSLFLVLLAGGLNDLMVVLPLTVFLLLLTLILKKNDSNLFIFKIILIFFFSVEFLLLIVALADVIYFFVARAHFHYIIYGFLVYAPAFFPSLLALLGSHRIILFFLTIISFFLVNYLVIKKVSNKNLPLKKVRIFLVIVLIILFLASIGISSKVHFSDFFTDEISNNLVTHLILITQETHCLPPALADQSIEEKKMESHSLVVNPLKSGDLYLDDEYPSVKASVNDICQLGIISDEQCYQDDDQDGFILKNDCDDSNYNIHPQAREILNNGIDEDCNGIDDAKPNIILIVLESFGAEYLSESIAPNIYKLKNNNLYFSNFYSNGTDTACSIVSTLCSIFSRPETGEIGNNLDIDLLCLPNILAEFGYYNLEMQAGDLDFLDKSQFFEKIGLVEYLGKDELGGRGLGSWGITDRRLFNQVAGRMDGLDQKSFFLTIYGLAIHHPWDLPVDANPLYPHDTLEHKVFNLLNYTDTALGEFIENNKNKEWFENSIIIITADNSQPTGKRVFNYVSFAGLYQENIWIPLIIIKNPKDGYFGELKGESNIVGSQTDIAPTILDLLGIETINHFQGKSLLRDDLSYQDSFMYAVCPFLGCLAAYRQGDYKIIKRFYRNIDLLFDLANDPDEENNLKEEQSEVFEALNEKILSIYLHSNYLYQNNKFWSPALQDLFEQSIKLKQAN